MPNTHTDHDELPDLPPADDDANELPLDEMPDLPDGGELPEEMPQEAPQAAQEPPAREADEILDPEVLVPATSILARLEGLPVVVSAAQRARELTAQASTITRIVTAEDRDQADHVRDQLKAHEKAVAEFFAPLCDAANKLHKGCTGLRNFAVGDVALQAKRLGDGIAKSIQVERDAEAARQRAAREEAARVERERLRQEAEAAEAERKRLDAEAAKEKDAAVAAQLKAQAEQAERDAAQARLDAATVTAPPVVAQEVAKPEGASARDNWKALPAHAEDWKDMPISDKAALILHVAERISARDLSLINLLDVSEKACNSLAKAQKSTLNVPGIRAVNPPVYAKRSRG